MKTTLDLFVFHLVFICLHAKSIRLMSHSVLLSASDSIVRSNLSEQQCLCQTSTNTSAVNYFTNGTCQLFTTTPCSYEVKINLKSRIYLLHPSFDPFRPGCSINGTELIETLNKSITISTIAVGARCLLIDDRGYLVVLLSTFSMLERYNPLNLTRIDRINITGSTPMSLSHFNGAYFLGLSSNNISVIDSIKLTVSTIISSSHVSGPRDMIFLNNGQMLVVASFSNDYLVFFSRSLAGSSTYSYLYRIPFSHQSPFGLWRVNNTFFYATSYVNNTILSYSAVNSSVWNENLVIDARPYTTNVPGNGIHVTIDPCDRFWFSLDFGGAIIFDRNGIFLGRLPFQFTSYYDIVITTDFTIYFSTSITSQIIRLQTNLTC